MIMTKQDIVLANARRIVEALNLPKETRDYVLRVISSPPSRNVGNRTGKNQLIDFSCSKMLFSVAVESVTIEGKYRLWLSFDPDVIAYFPQPERRVIFITDAKGIRRKVLKTFDFLVIYRDRVELVECKPLKWLVEMSKTRPNMASLRGKSWTSEDIEKQLAEAGLVFRYVMESDISTVLAKNITVLELVQDRKYSSRDALSRLRTKLTMPATLKDIIDASSGYTKEDVYLAILKGDVYVNLERDALASHERTFIYRDRSHAELAESIETSVAVPTMPLPFLEAGGTVCMNGQDLRFANRRGAVLEFLDTTGELVRVKEQALCALVRAGAIQLPGVAVQETTEVHSELSDTLDPDELSAARQKEVFLLAWNDGRSPREEDYGLKKITRRQKQRWWRRYRDARSKYGNGLFGLFRRRSSFVRISPLPERTRELMKEVADELYFVPDRVGPKACYRELEVRCKEESAYCPSLKTFRTFLVNANNSEDAARLREGERAAYKYSRAKAWDENWLTADDFCEKYAHLDATQLDVELADSISGQKLGRPWLTRLFCPCLHAPWAFVLSFDEPSYREAMLVMRVAFERWGFLPRYISVDNGREFHHTAFEQLLHVFGIHRVVRPPAKSRYGSAIESSFETLRKECINALRGNTQATKNVRQMTKKTSPRTRAVWTLPLLHDHLLAYDKIIWETIAPNLGTSPQDSFARRKCYTPEMPLVIFPDDFAAVVFMPPSPHGEAKVQPGRGVCVGGVYYWHEEFRHPRIERSKVEVRFDPFDLSVAFARVNGVWVICRAMHHPQLAQCTEKQMRIATIERRHVRHMYPRLRDTQRGPKLALLNREGRETEKLRLQKQRDIEAASIRPKSVREPESKVSSKLPEWDFSHILADAEPTEGVTSADLELSVR